MTAKALSVVIPTFRRVDALQRTLQRLFEGGTEGLEVLVHVDAGDADTAPMLATEFPQVRCLQAEVSQGPGGARNRLLREARHEIVVSLDDDSYPMDPDFFARVLVGFAAHPEAGVLAMTIVHDGEAAPKIHARAEEVADFVGCGCAYRQAAFLDTQGYVPLHPAYGMEEADLALQLIDRGWKIVHRHDLRIRHATDRSHQTATPVVAAHIRNTALLAFLRYPPRYTGFAIMQYLNRIVYSLRRGHLRGAVVGVIGTPVHLGRHRKLRAPLRAATIETARQLRKAGQRASLPRKHAGPASART
ncbi:MAG: glycosyltransferase family 2 protein [Pseudomonadota bacterium]